MKKLLLLLLLIPFNIFAQSIPFQLTPAGHILVKAKIEGKEGNFIFDTGGGINLFFNDFAKDLSQQQSYNFFTAFRATGERIDCPIFHSKEISFGGKTFKNTVYTTFDMKINGINGLISLPMLEDTDFIIDYKQKQIILGEIKSTKNIKSFDIQLATIADNATDIFTYVVLNGKYKIKVLLDSGAGSNSFWLSDKLIATLNLNKETLETIEKKSEFNANQTTKIYTGSIASISNDYATVNNPKVNFIEGLIYEGKTSINWLGNKIGFSLKKKKIYILD